MNKKTISSTSSSQQPVDTSELSAEQYRVTQQCGTEPPFSGAYVNHNEKGIYSCVVCGNQLFDSSSKYDSGSGWPSFFAALKGDQIKSRFDESHGMRREEVLCANCDAHLGHVFPDGPEPTGLRFCVNSASLNFLPVEKTKQGEGTDSFAFNNQFLADDSLHFVSGNLLLPPFSENLETAVFALGCFWGAEKKFWQLEGVYSTAVGYAGGELINPDYHQVCHSDTGYAEVVLVVFDPAVITYSQLLEVFWQGHDPTQGMRQGYDVGRQYRSMIMAMTVEQEKQAKDSLLIQQQQRDATMTTDIIRVACFNYAEDYHQQYLAKRGS
ncbi:MAG: peptide-methionine (R)-S-oxide reductase MsrB [Xanthomonadales bacterium]|nr:peptide-methionine (R)-S-oxide reductase MsrB [Xanthomonadales bacterium]